MKRKVVYIELRSPLLLGKPVIVVPINHTSGYVDNGYPAQTTPVITIGPESGVFETANSRYVPLADLEPAIEKEQEACLQN
jgi:hypothetical protein